MYDFERAVQVRYQDLDTIGVANNALYATYLEEGRHSYLESFLGLRVADARVVLAHLELDFFRPVTEPGEVVVRVRTEDVGTSSFTLSYEIARDGEMIATAESVQVTVDERGESRDLPDDWRDAFESRVASAHG